MRYIISIFLLSLLLGCQTTETAVPTSKVNLETKVEKLEDKLENPFAGNEIPPNITVTSTKPVICGRIDIILTNMQNKFGEVPVFIGKSETASPIGKDYNIITLTYNQETKTFTFFEQMPLEKRLLCMLASGKGEINMNLLKGTTL